MKLGYLPLVLHLAPAKTSGIEVCPNRTKFCTAVCLNLAGRGGMGVTRVMTSEERARVNEIQQARLNRTLMFRRDPDLFYELLERDIRAAIDAARTLRFVGTKCGKPIFEPRTPDDPELSVCVRLNGTSDIVWERERPQIFERFPNVIFYDYTKVPNRFDRPPNYFLTYSWNEQKVALDRSGSYFAHRVNTAVVFSTARGERLPSAWGPKGRGRRPVIDGDEYDMRFLDPEGVYVGLRAKGWARDPEVADGFTVWLGGEAENPPLALADFDGGDLFADLDDAFGHIDWTKGG